MLPLASASGLAVVTGAISASLLFLWWLLRAESRDADEEEATEPAEAEAAREAVEDSPRV
jgi:hypothetical protein